MPRSRVRLPVLLFCLCAAGQASCSTQRPFPSGMILAEPITYEIHLLYTEPPREDPRTALSDLLAQDFAGFIQVDEIHEEEIGHRRLLRATWLTDARKSYEVPDLEGLSYFGRGLNDAQAAALQRCERVLVLYFGYGKEHRWTGMRDALRLTSTLARRNGALIWDAESREMFTPDYWDQHRVATWSETAGPPELWHHFTIHTYRRENGLGRSITLGLKKFGLPDIVVEDYAESLTEPMTFTITHLAQAFAEGEAVGSNGDFDLDIRRLCHTVLPAERLASLGTGLAGEARLRLVRGIWEEGDPYNRLAAIGFSRYPGPDLQARQRRLVDAFFGRPEVNERIIAEHDAAILEASRRAREKLFALKPAFLAGLPPGEVLLVKAPFPIPDAGREWLWVEIAEWKGERIIGTLHGHPVYIKTLEIGQRVEVSEADVFDYIHAFANGSSEGNETEKYLHPQK